MRTKMRLCESSEKSSALKLFGGFRVGGIIEKNGAKDGFFRVDIRGQSGVKRSDVRQGGHTLRV